MTLFNDLVDSGFEVTLSVSRGRDDVTLSVPRKGLGSEPIQLLVAKVADHGARVLVDDQGSFEIWFEERGR